MLKITTLYRYNISFKVFLVLVLFSANLFSQSLSKKTTSKLDSVSLQLRFYHQFQFAGYYAALEKGYYEDEGLYVNIIEGSPNTHRIYPVLTGKYNYGVSSSDIVSAKMKGEPIRLLATIFQHSPLCIMTIKDNGINSPSDLVGKKVIEGDELENAEILAMLKKEGISLDQIISIKDKWNIDDLIVGNVDAVLAYASHEPFILQKMEYEPYLIKPIDYGIDFYGDALFTSDREVEEYPERAEAFRRASLKGWKYAMDNKKEIIDLILNFDSVKKRGVSREALSFEATAMESFIIPDIIEIGHINPERLEKIARIYSELGIISGPYSLNNFIFNHYKEVKKIGKETFWWILILGIFSVLIVLWLIWKLRKVIKIKTDELKEEVRKNKEQLMLQREMEVSFRKKSERSDALLKGIPDLIFRLSIDGKYLAFNSPEDSELSIPEEDIVGKGLFEVLPKNVAELVQNTIYKAMHENLSQRIEYWLPYNDYNRKFEARIIKSGEEEVFAIVRDITNEDKTLTALLQSEEKFYIIFHSSPEPIIITKFESGEIIEANKSFARLMGYKISEVLGRTTTELKIWKSISDRVQLVKILSKNGIANNYEIKIQTKTGELKTGLISAETTEINDEKCIVSIIKDITERKDKTEALRISEERFSKAFRSSPDAIYITRISDGEIIEINEKTEEISGYSRVEILGKTIFELNVWGKEDERNYFLSLLEKDGRVREFETTFRTKSGKLIYGQISAEIIIINNEKSILGIIRDVTERKKETEALRISEEKFSKIFRSSPNSIVITDLNSGIILDANNNFCNTTGFKLSEVIGKSVIELSIWKDESEREKYINILVKNKRARDYESHFRRKNREIFPVIISSEVVTLNEQTIIIGNYVDISNIKENEQKLKNSLEEVEILKSRLINENIYLQEEIMLDNDFYRIITKNNEYKDILSKIEKVAPTDATVLILGETGTGKELLARSVHDISNRSSRPLVKVNCAALPENLIESELFGHVKGAFTGAIKDKVGRFELADGGTIFLDEIGELPIELQSKLLRVLQESEFEKLGSSKTIKVDVRLIAATNRNLELLVKEGIFREDLYFRLNVFPIESIPLRKRKEDIPILVNYFIKEFNQKMGKKVNQISKTTLEELKNYSWPGNVRELENIIERAIILANDDKLVVNQLLNTTISKNTENDKPQTLYDVEKEQIYNALSQSNWKIEGEGGAAKILDIPPSTLRDKIKKYNLSKKS